MDLETRTRARPGAYAGDSQPHGIVREGIRRRGLAPETFPVPQAERPQRPGGVEVKVRGELHIPHDRPRNALELAGGPEPVSAQDGDVRQPRPDGPEGTRQGIASGQPHHHVGAGVPQRLGDVCSLLIRHVLLQQRQLGHDAVPLRVQFREHGGSQSATVVVIHVDQGHPATVGEDLAQGLCQKTALSVIRWDESETVGAGLRVEHGGSSRRDLDHLTGVVDRRRRQARGAVRVTDNGNQSLDLDEPLGGFDRRGGKILPLRDHHRIETRHRLGGQLVLDRQTSGVNVGGRCRDPEHHGLGGLAGQSHGGQGNQQQWHEGRTTVEPIHPDLLSTARGDKTPTSNEAEGKVYGKSGVCRSSGQAQRRVPGAAMAFAPARARTSRAQRHSGEFIVSSRPVLRKPGKPCRGTRRSTVTQNRSSRS